MSQGTRGRTALSSDRWKIIAVVGGLGLVVCAIAIALQQRTPPARSLPLEARLELAAGNVSLTRDGQVMPAISGAAVLKGSTLSAGKGARALARLSDGAALFLRDETEIGLGEGEVELLRGEIWLDAPPSERRATVYKVGDGSVSAANAGLSVRRSDDEIKVYVARGLATFTTKAGRVEVQAGEQALAKPGAAPVVSPVAYWVDWTGGMGDHRMASPVAGAGSGRIYGVDLQAAANTPPSKLEISQQAVRAVLRDGLAETEVDQTFFNPGARPVEGWYWFSVPERASVTAFELETNGVLIPGELIERQEASRQYQQGVRRGNDPALLEWIDARTFRARIYPVPAGGTRRVVLRYIELAPLSDGTLRYLYPLQAAEPTRIGEFSLAVDLGEAGQRMHITTLAEARVEEGGRRVTMRRSGYTPRTDFLLEARLDAPPPAFRVAQFVAGDESASYLMARYTPEIDWDKHQPRAADVVLVVDTSAAADDAAKQLKLTAAEAVLRALSAEDHFALVSLDVRPRVLHPDKELAPATDDQIAAALEKLADHASGGATDLAALFDVALARVHASEQPAVIYVGDGLATTGEMSGEQLAERLRRALSTSRARFFSVAVGGEADRGVLDELARVGGGRMFVLDSSEEATERALRLAAAVKTPTVTDFDIDLGAGLDEVYLSATGKVSRGEEVVLLARTHHDLPTEVTVRGRIAGKDFEHKHRVHHDRSVLGAFVPRLWATEQMRRILGQASEPDAERGRIVKLGLDYGLMTPYTSFLALDSEAAYRQQGIQRRQSRLRGVRLGALSSGEEAQLLTALYGVAVGATGMGCNRSDEAAQVVSGQVATEQSRHAARRQRPARATGAAAPVLADGVAAEMAPAAEPMDEGGAVARGKRAEAEVLAGGLAGKDDDRASVGKSRDAKSVGLGAGGSGDKAWRVALVEEGVCSDASLQPLSKRIVLWNKRFKTAGNAPELVERYRMARSACEISDWRSESSLLRLLARRVKDAATASQVLTLFASLPETQRFVARVVLRGAVDQNIARAVEQILFGQEVRWDAVDRKLAELADPAQRVEFLKEALARKPDDSQGVVRLVRALAEAGQMEEALLHGRRLHDQGLITPLLARELGDVLARHGKRDEAIRTYSEIVEFDPSSVDSRRLLGDIYLAHGWYDEAYRQFATLTEIADDEPVAWLRLAAAAAGSGRVDEALRIERKVAQEEGKPGPSDPRRWARLASAARLARMIAEPPATPAGTDAKQLAEALNRQLKQLQLFRGPSTLVIVTWEDLARDIALSAQGIGAGAAADSAPSAGPVGVAAVTLAPNDVDAAQLIASLRSAASDRELALRRTDIAWDGQHFDVKVAPVELPSGAAQVDL